MTAPPTTKWLTLALVVCAVVVVAIATAVSYYRKISAEKLVRDGRPVPVSDLQAVIDAIQRIGPEEDWEDLVMEGNPLKRHAFDSLTQEILVVPQKGARGYGILIYEGPERPL